MLHYIAFLEMVSQEDIGSCLYITHDIHLKIN